jgi:hypothetical protein
MLERIKEYLDSFKGDDIYLVFENIEDDLKLEIVDGVCESEYSSTGVYYSDEYKSWYEVSIGHVTLRAYVVKVIPKQITKTILEEV